MTNILDSATANVVCRIFLNFFERRKSICMLNAAADTGTLLHGL